MVFRLYLFILTLIHICKRPAKETVGAERRRGRAARHLVSLARAQRRLQVLGDRGRPRLQGTTRLQVSA